MLRAYWDRLPERLSPSPLARGGPPRGQALPTPRARRPGPRVPSRVQTPHDEIDSLGSPRLPPAAHRATRPGARGPMQGRPLSRGYRPVPPLRLRRTTIDSASAHRAPGKGERPSPPPRAVAPAMPCHPPHRPSTVGDHSHTDSPTLAGLETRAQTFRGPNPILRGHYHTHKVGLRRPAGQVLPTPPSLPTGEDGGAALAPLPWGTQSPGPRRPGPLDVRPGPSTTGARYPLASDAVNWQRTGQGSLESHPGTWDRAPAPTDDYLAPRPSISPSAAKAHVRLIQPTGDGSSTSRGGPRAPVMPVAAP